MADPLSMHLNYCCHQLPCDVFYLYLSQSSSALNQGKQLPSGTEVCDEVDLFFVSEDINEADDVFVLEIL